MPFSKAKMKIELEKGRSVVGSGRNTLSCGFPFSHSGSLTRTPARLHIMQILAPFTVIHFVILIQTPQSQVIGFPQDRGAGIFMIMKLFTGAHLTLKVLCRHILPTHPPLAEESTVRNSGFNFQDIH